MEAAVCLRGHHNGQVMHGMLTSGPSSLERKESSLPLPLSPSAFLFPIYQRAPLFLSLSTTPPVTPPQYAPSLSFNSLPLVQQQHLPPSPFHQMSFRSGRAMALGCLDLLCSEATTQLLSASLLIPFHLIDLLIASPHWAYQS
jgi:hypothetical protein